jgi:hypothetical protein
MDEIDGVFFEGPESIAHFDQYHAHAIEMLRNATSFYLVAVDDTGKARYTTAIENGEEKGVSDPQEVVDFITHHVMAHAAWLIRQAKAEQRRREVEGDDGA